MLSVPVQSPAKPKAIVWLLVSVTLYQSALLFASHKKPVSETALLKGETRLIYMNPSRPKKNRNSGSDNAVRVLFVFLEQYGMPDVRSGRHIRFVLAEIAPCQRTRHDKGKRKDSRQQQADDLVKNICIFIIRFHRLYLPGYS